MINIEKMQIGITRDQLASFLQNISNMPIFHIILYTLLALLLMLRRPDAILNPQPWAEDGAVFLQAAIESSYHSIFALYAGYLHFIPRLTALFALQLGLAIAPLIMNLIALLITVACASYFFNKDFRFIVKNDSLRFFISIVIVCMPISEIWLNITNIQWLLLIYLTLWSLNLSYNFDPIFDNLGVTSILQVIFLALAFFSCPLSIIVLPFLIRAIVKKTVNGTIFKMQSLYVLIPALSLALHMAISLINNVGNKRLPGLYDLSAYISNSIISYFYYPASNLSILNFDNTYHYDLLLFFSFLVLSIILIQSYLLGDHRVDAFIISLIAIGILITAVSRPQVIDILIHAAPRSMGGRYSLFPVTFLLIVLVRNLEKYGSGQRHSRHTGLKALNLGCYLILILFMINVFINFHIPALEDKDFAYYAKYYEPRGGQTGVIPINPSGWQMIIPTNITPIPVPAINAYLSLMLVPR
jgi:hypothetical protein